MKIYQVRVNYKTEKSRATDFFLIAPDKRAAKAYVVEQIRAAFSGEASVERVQAYEKYNLKKLSEGQVVEFDMTHQHVGPVRWAL